MTEGDGTASLCVCSGDASVTTELAVSGCVLEMWVTATVRGSRASLPRVALVSVSYFPSVSVQKVAMVFK